METDYGHLSPLLLRVAPQREIQAGWEENRLYSEGGKILAQAAQRGDRCTIPGGVQGQARCSSGQPDLVEDVPAHCRGGWTR